MTTGASERDCREGKAEEPLDSAPYIATTAGWGGSAQAPVHGEFSVGPSGAGAGAGPGRGDSRTTRARGGARRGRERKWAGPGEGRGRGESRTARDRAKATGTPHRGRSFPDGTWIRTSKSSTPGAQLPESPCVAVGLWWRWGRSTISRLRRGNCRLAARARPAISCKAGTRGAGSGERERGGLVCPRSSRPLSLLQLGLQFVTR